MLKKAILLAIVSALLSFTLTNNFRELVIEKLDAYAKNPPEKIYVQTDKPYYSLGEDIWYTAYLVNGITHSKSKKSSVIYVELINEQDSIISLKKLYTDNISVAGDFNIDKDLKPGNYLLRAYTNYMRNNNSDYFFQKEIPIWNPTKSIDTKTEKKNTAYSQPPNQSELTKKPDISFYPESGYLINGIQNKIGIKVKGNKNVNITGYIKDFNNNIISVFETYEFGLGNTSLIPKTNKNYYASVNIGNQEFRYNLPKALDNGYILNTINNGQEIIIKVTTNHTIGLKNTLLIGHQRGKLIFEKLETKNNHTYSIKLKTNVLSDGITNFTLFDSSGKPVCERLVFIENPNNIVEINIQSNNESPTTRDKVSMSLELTDKEGNNLAGNLSMSITDVDAVNHSTIDENIKTYLLLNSDLRGYIENPGYFFEKENDAKRRYLLDLVMLTHGWRRFTWTEVLYNSKKQDKFKPEKGLYISGNTSALKEDKSRIQAPTRLTFMGEVPHQEYQKSDINGNFKYGPYIFNDTLPTLIEARTNGFKSEQNKNNRSVSINLLPDFFSSPKVIRNEILKSNLSDTSKISNYLNQAQKISKIEDSYLKTTTLLEEVLINAKKETEEELRDQSMSDRTNYGEASHRLDIQEEFKSQAHLSIFELMRMLPGVNIINGDSISIRNQGTPLIFLDNAPVFMDDILNLTGNEVDFIDLLTGANASFYSGGGNGVIAIYLKTGINISAKNIKRKPGIIDFTSVGFYTAREFYAPNHLNGFDESIKQDIRTTLHWEPKIQLTETSNKAEISFFTSDTRSRYAIKIEGITDTGIPVYHSSIFEVD